MLLGMMWLAACTNPGMTIAGGGVEAGINYTLSGTAERTFTASLAEVHRATRAALRRMDIRVDRDDVDTDERRITCQAGDRQIEIHLRQLAPRTTMQTVVVAYNAILRDRATAREVILQTARTVEVEPTRVEDVARGPDRRTTR